MKKNPAGPPQRITRQRAIILEELRKVNTHPTADEIYHMARLRLPRISLGTVYRNLDALGEQGEILKIGSAGNMMRFDGNPHPHIHARCRKCGRVTDVAIPVQAPDTRHVVLPGFTITGVRLEFDGLCELCKKKQVENHV